MLQLMLSIFGFMHWKIAYIIITSLKIFAFKIADCQNCFLHDFYKFPIFPTPLPPATDWV